MIQSWKKNDKQYTLITLNSRRLVQKRSNHVQYKILPSLKQMFQIEPMNFLNYQKAKKSRKNALEKQPPDAHLFLEGEYYSAVPMQVRQPRPKCRIADYSTMPNLQRKRANNISNEIKRSQLPYTTTIKEDEVQLRHSNTNKCSNSTSNNKQENKEEQSSFSQLRRRPAKNLSTIQTDKKRSPAKERSNKSLSSLKYVDNIDAKLAKKPLFYLEKKQLSKIKAQSFIVMQYPSMKILTANRHKNPAQIASITKVMTFYAIYQLVQEYQIDMSKEKVTVDEVAGNMTGTSAQLVSGDVLTVEELLYGLMLPSGNDAAMALASWGGKLISGEKKEQGNTVETFIILMNKCAKQLELRHSSFGNPHGLPNYRNSSTPYDVSLLIAACLQIPLFCTVVNTQIYKKWINNSGVKKEMIWQNTNKLIRRQGFIGVKTGVTVTAGPCLASCYQHKDKKFIVVLLRTNKLSRRFKQTRMLLGWSLRQYDRQTYGQAARTILKHDANLDSDNSEDEDEFNYDKMDANQLAKRNKILQYEL